MLEWLVLVNIDNIMKKLAYWSKKFNFLIQKNPLFQNTWDNNLCLFDLDKEGLKKYLEFFYHLIQVFE